MSEPSDTEILLRRVRAGDLGARAELLDRNRDRLRRLIAMRIDRRIGTRLDPSDVIQEAMHVASTRFTEYLEGPPRPFYTWLRGIALDRLIELYRRHLGASKRSVLREEAGGTPLNDESECELARQLVELSGDPYRRMLITEMMARVRAALEKLSPNDREILTLRHLEQLTVDEIADVLKISKSAVTTRHLRALQRLRDSLGGMMNDSA